MGMHTPEVRIEILSRMKLFRPKPAPPSQCRAFFKRILLELFIAQSPYNLSSFLDLRNGSSRFRLFAREFRRFRFSFPRSACFFKFPPPGNLPSCVKCYEIRKFWKRISIDQIQKGGESEFCLAQQNSWVFMFTYICASISKKITIIHPPLQVTAPFWFNLLSLLETVL